VYALYNDYYENILIYFENKGTDGFAPADTLNVSSVAADDFAFLYEASLIDNDNDGDLDALGVGVINSGSGYNLALLEWENVGTAEEPSFSGIRIDPSFNLIALESEENVFFTEIEDYDNDGDPDILLSAYNYESYQTDLTYFENDNGYKPGTPINVPTAFDGFLITTAGDIDGDGDTDLLFELYNQDSPQLVTSDLYWMENLSMSSNVSWLEEIGQAQLVGNVITERLNLELDLIRPMDVGATITNEVGQQISTIDLGTVATGRHTVDVNDLSPGIYFLTLSAEDQLKTLKFVKN